MKLFTVHDTTAETFAPPFTVQSLAEMERAIRLLNEKDPEHKFVKYASELTLIELGEFDHNTGEVSLYPQHKTISVLSKYKQ